MNGAPDPNDLRPHSSLGMTPPAFSSSAAPSGGTHRPMFPADAVRDRLRGARQFNDRLAAEPGSWGPEFTGNTRNEPPTLRTPT